MTGKSENPNTPADDNSENDAVAEYLRRNPSFLVDNPDLVVTLTPPDFRHGEDVIDMQRFMLDSLQKHIQSLSSREKKVLAIAEDRIAEFGRVQDGAELLLGANSFRELVRAVNFELPDLLDIDSARLCLERGETGIASSGAHVLASGVADNLIGRKNDVALLEESADRRALVGMENADVKSLALIRLSTGNKTARGVLALGSTETDGFNPRQGTDLLSFLARVIESCMRRWQNDSH
ncbi:MAG: DUF484 family protein [Pseudomonadota bacterium]|nr:DUF484 family protein [Pseudomonadota bacterium]